MANAGSHRIKIYRCVLTSSTQFEAYVNRIGRPQFAITCVGDQFDEHGPSLAPGEWLFTNDVEELMKDFFAWDARGVHMELVSSETATGRSANWIVVGLSDYLNKSARHLNTRRLGAVCKVIGTDGARKAFLEAVFEDAGSYGFIALHVNQYNRFIDEWKTNDDKAARPADYRAQKRFGVISAAGGLGIDGPSVHYWASIGWTSGWLTRQQLQEVGLTCDVLVGQTCVINGLGEVEWIGNILLPQCSG